MDINNQFNQELLSAYLDDKLTAAELAQVETWLATDPTAVDYLNELRSNRHTLKALASLPGLTLKSSMAARVLAQIHAAEPQSQHVPLPTIDRPSSRQWWVWGSLAATAAAVTWLAVLPLMQPPKPLPLVSKTETTVVQPGPEELAGNEPRNSHDLLKDTLPEGLPGDKPLEYPVPGGIGVGSGNRGPDERQGVVKLPIQFLLIADVLVKPKAWDDGKFDQLLEKYGIRYEKELVAKPNLIQGLVESQVTSGPDADPASQQNAALVYVDCPAKTLNKLLIDIESDSENFAAMKYGTAMGGGEFGIKTSYDLMLNALREQTGGSQGRSIARLIVPTGTNRDATGLLSAFDVPKRNTDQELRDVAVQETARGKTGKGNLQIESDASESLLILRKQ